MKSLRKLVPAFSLLLVSAIILSSASFAWFTMSRQVTANGMDVTVTAPDNLLIDAAANDGNESWEAIETLSVTGVNLVPASTIDGANIYYLDNSGAKSDGDLNPESVVVKAGSADTKAFYDFKYKVKTEGTEAVKVALKSLTVVDNGGSKSLKPVRVAILTGDAASPSNVATVGGVASAWALYAPGYPTTTADHFEAGKALKGTKAAGVTVTDYRTANADTVTYRATKTNAAEPGDNEVLFTAPASHDPVYVTIRVWYEGEDTECNFADASGSKFSVTAVFAAVPRA